MGIERTNTAAGQPDKNVERHAERPASPSADPPAADAPRADSRSTRIVADEKSDLASDPVAGRASEAADPRESPPMPSMVGDVNDVAAEPPEGLPEPTDREPDRTYADRLDTPLGKGEVTPRQLLERFDPARAGLPDLTRSEVANHINTYAGERPWLAAAGNSAPESQRVLAVMDRGQGHALERHEGYADDDKLQRRVTRLEDPAQLDDTKRAQGIDGCRPGDQNHRCGDYATAIQDPDAFATAFASGIEHPEVRSALQEPYQPFQRPDPVSVPIDDLLGPGGSRYCSGYRLEPVDGSMAEAHAGRSAWVDAQRTPGREAEVPEPLCTPIDDFGGGHIGFFFRPNGNNDGYEVATMYVDPPPG